MGSFGSVDILVNNAGLEKKADFWDVTEEDYDRVLSVNLKGPFFLTQAFVRRLRSVKKTGRIINISSVHEDIAFPGFTSYCASKGGMRMLMRSLAVELGPEGFTINNVAPGAISTPMNKSLLEDKPKLNALLANIPVGRLGTTDDVADLWPSSPQTRLPMSTARPLPSMADSRATTTSNRRRVYSQGNAPCS